MLRVPVQPELLRWARERAGLEAGRLARRFPKLEAWESGAVLPTLKQLERYAKATHAPIGYFFLAEPPVEEVPIPDCRTVGNEHIGHPSPDLLDTIHLCQARQDWYRDYARVNREDPRRFVGSVSVGDGVVETAASMRATLGFEVAERRALPTWEAALRRLVSQVEEAGILVMINGVVANNTHRPLDPEEFRGFALADDLAPLVFVNGADTKAAQIFTLAHELAHLWLGASGVSDASAAAFPRRRVEKWCNQVAAELLVPLTDLRAMEERGGSAALANLSYFARVFKVSTLMVLRRLHDVGWLTREQMWDEYRRELRRLMAIRRSDSGGDFHRTEAVRCGRRFASALVASTVAGQTLYTDAFRLLGVKKAETVHELGRSLAVI